MLDSMHEPLCQKSRHKAEDSQGDLYEIQVLGYLDKCWSEWLDGMEISHGRQGVTTLSGWVSDQPALYGLLLKIRDLNMKLLLVKKK
jgi:hypothetical protein